MLWHVGQWTNLETSNLILDLPAQVLTCKHLIYVVIHIIPKRPVL